LFFWGAPRAEVVCGEAVLGALGVEELTKLHSRDSAVEGFVRLVVPLHKPGQKLQNTREHWLQALFGPALLAFAFAVKSREGHSALSVIPTGPTVNRFAVFIRLTAWVRDETLLGHIEFTAELPISGRAKVLGIVLGRHGD